MFDDELEPKNKPPKPKNLEPMSIDELENYIQDMNDEIIRVQDEIKRKKAYQEAADSIFKS